MSKYCRTFAACMRHFAIFLLLFFSLSLSAQTAAKANTLFEKGHYTEADEAYAALLKRAPSNHLYNYRYARCLQEQGEYKEALKYFAKSGNKYSLRYFFEGECYYHLWMTSEAVNAYNEYIKEAPHNDRMEYINRRIAISNTRQRYLKRVQDISITDSVILPKKDFLEAYRLSHTAGEIKDDGNGLVSYCNQRGDRCIYTATENGEQVLVNKYKLLDSWSHPDTLGETINFTSRQNYPYYMSDGITLYFAACDTLGMGGWDIYITRYNSATNTFTTPENIGYPFNSESNDYMYVIDEEKQVGYFATDRFCTGDSVCVYQFLLQDLPSYISSSDIDTLSLYARLIKYHTAEKPVITAENEPQPEDTQAVEEEEQYRLVISPDRVYTSDSDFVSQEALSLYKQYLAVLAQWQQQKEELDSLREAYRSAQPQQRKQLAADIRDKEQKEAESALEVRTLLNSVRQTEMKAVAG